MERIGTDAGTVESYEAPPVPAGPFADLVDAFAAAIGGRLDAVVGVAGPRELASALGDLERLGRIAEAAAVAIAGDVDDRALFAADGHRSAKAWMLASVRIPGSQARRRVQTAGLLHDLPQLAELLVSGRLGVAQVRELARAHSAPRTGRFIEPAIDYLLESAVHDDFELFVVKLREFERLVDADGAHHGSDEAHKGRNCRLDTVGDITHLDGRFGAAQAAVIKAVFDAFVDAEYAADCEEARRQYGGSYLPSVLSRTAAQRRADAMVAMCEAAAGAPLDAKPIDVCINVVIDAATFEEQLADRLDPLHRYRGSTSTVSGGDAFGAPGESRRRLCHLVDGTAVDPLDAVVAAFWGHVRRVVVGSDGVIINLGRRCRLFTGSSREAGLLQAGLDRFGRCLWPGCRLAHCQLDHTKEWQEFGVTDVANSGPTCGHHNRFKSSGYRARRDGHGHWHTYRPDGTEIRAV